MYMWKSSSSFNSIGEKTALYCKTCKKPGMVNVVSKLCCDCDTQASLKKAIRQSEHDYKIIYLCSPCAIARKLHDPHNIKKSGKRFKKEMNLIKQTLPSSTIIDLHYENKIYTDCLDHETTCKNQHWVQVDAVLQYRKTYWLIENDERQHSDRILSCELNRMSKAIGAIRLQGIQEPVIFLRFNPDAYNINGKLERTSKKSRFAKLKSVIETYEPSQDFEIVYMYYDTIDTELCIQKDADLDPLLNNLVKIV